VYIFPCSSTAICRGSGYVVGIFSTSSVGLVRNMETKEVAISQLVALMGETVIESFNALEMQCGIPR
jgi:hypothetical protein